MTTLAPWFLSLHALERMGAMGVERCEVVACLEEPEVDRQVQPAPRRVASRGRLAVVYNGANRTVVTVLWRAQEVTTR